MGEICIFKEITVFCLGHELWDKALPYLTSPVEKALTVDKVPKKPFALRKQHRP